MTVFQKVAVRIVAALAVLMMVAVMPFASFAEEPGATPADRQGEVWTGVQLQNVGENDTTASVTLYNSTGGTIGLEDNTIAAGAAVNYFMPNFENVPGGSYSLVATAEEPLKAMVSTSYQTSNSAGNYSSPTPGSSVIVPVVLRDWAGQTSEITVQNASTSNTVDYTVTVNGRQNSGTDQLTGTLEPGSARTYSLNDFGVENNGTAEEGTEGGFLGYALVEASNGQVVVQSFIDIAGAGAIAAFIGIPADSADTTLYAPLIRKNFFGDTGIQLVNTGDTDANVTVTYYTDPSRVGAGFDAEYNETATVPANDAFTVLQLAGSGPLPEGSDRSGGWDPTNDGWFGSAKIVSDVPLIGVVNDVTFAGFATSNQATYTLSTASNAGTEFVSPLVRAGFLDNNLFTTGVACQNTTDSPANVTLSYDIVRADGSTERVSGSGGTIPANGATTFYQGGDDRSNGASIDGVAGWYGSAVISSDQPIVCLVNDESDNIPGVSVAPTLVDKANFNALKLQ